MSPSPPTCIHTDTLFKTLHCLPIAHRIRTKLFTIAYKSLHNQAPAYLFFLILPPLLHHVLATLGSLHWKWQLCSYLRASVLIALLLGMFSLQIVAWGPLVIQVSTIITSLERPSFSTVASPPLLLYLILSTSQYLSSPEIIWYYLLIYSPLFIPTRKQFPEDKHLDLSCLLPRRMPGTWYVLTVWWMTA